MIKRKDQFQKKCLKLATIIPIVGIKTEFDQILPDIFMPVGKNITIIEHAISQAAWAGCESIWIVCEDHKISLLKSIIGEWIYDPERTFHKRPDLDGKLIPIFYVPIHPKDKKRTSLIWSILWGARVATKIFGRLSFWTIPDRFYVVFPMGIHRVNAIEKSRLKISNINGFFGSFEGQTILDNKLLPFTFTSGELFQMLDLFRKKFIEYINSPLKKEKTLNEFLELKDIFSCVTMENAYIDELEWFYDLSKWGSYSKFMGERSNQTMLPTYLFNKKYKREFKISKEIMAK